MSYNTGWCQLYKVIQHYSIQLIFICRHFYCSYFLHIFRKMWASIVGLRFWFFLFACSLSSLPFSLLLVFVLSSLFLSFLFTTRFFMFSFYFRFLPLSVLLSFCILYAYCLSFFAFSLSSVYYYYYYVRIFTCLLHFLCIPRDRYLSDFNAREFFLYLVQEFLYIHAYVYVRMYWCMYLFTYVCMHACMHVCMFVCMYVRTVCVYGMYVCM